MKTPLLVLLASMALSTAVSAEPLYIDDRSSAERLVQSLYSAINRKEFARAWSYFSTPPTKDYDSFAAGYEKTVSVEALTGKASADGAAGSIFFSVPVAIRAIDEGGAEKTFAGCYTVRQVNAQGQEPPFRPLAIEKGKLKPSDDALLEAALPEKCDDAPQPEQDLEAMAVARYAAEHEGQCGFAPAYVSGVKVPARHELSFRTNDDPTSEPLTATLFAFECALYAYNMSSVYYLYSQNDGLRLVSFPEPEIEFNYADDESTKLASWSVKGLRSTAYAIDADYTPASQSITSYSKWRGLGDASSSGTWRFTGLGFVLKDFEVDPTFDGELNPITVLKDGQFQ